MDDLESDATDLVLRGKTLVCACHTKVHRWIAAVPVQWGAPRILVLPGSIEQSLGEDCKRAPFAESYVWRYEWDPFSELAIALPGLRASSTDGGLGATIKELIEILVSGKFRVPDEESGNLSGVSESTGNVNLVAYGWQIRGFPPGASNKLPTACTGSTAARRVESVTGRSGRRKQLA